MGKKRLNTSTNYKGLSSLIVFSTVLQLVIIWIYRCLGGFDEQEFTLLYVLIIPILGSQTGMVIEYLPFVGNSGKEKPESVQKGFNTIVYYFILGQLLLIIMVISLKAFYPNKMNFNNLIIAICAIETLFGFYISKVLSVIFSLVKNEQN